MGQYKSVNFLQHYKRTIINTIQMELLDKLNWRYAAKAMNGEKVAQDKIDNILEAAILAPTSSGLQPFEILVVTNQEIKEKIRAIGWNQSVITDCSHLLVFAAWDTYTAERINKVFDHTIFRVAHPLVQNLITQSIDIRKFRIKFPTFYQYLLFKRICKK